MLELIEANWPLFLIAFLIGLAIAFYLFKATRRTRVTVSSKDVLDEGAEPARRNQALIDVERGAAEAEKPRDSAASASTVPTSSDSGDDLTRIKGLGPKIAVLLNELGVTTYAQIAAWSDEDIARIDPKLGRFSGRIERDQWVHQAGLLAENKEGEFNKEFGRIS